ncbi:Photosystem I assembly protein Ycf3 [Arenibacter antarcticus]|uniref:Tetratricopeptide repeat protein n=2 Tax=Arenibacter antarcticus TaxID=2040469 RepID=A0ABW5VCD5_9FLAO|nr:tetratricopeptide repeat protein [Arenibacter sp. H213]
MGNKKCILFCIPQATSQRALYLSYFLFLVWTGCMAQNKLEDLRQNLSLATNDSLQISLKMKISRELHRQAEHAEEDIEIAKEAVDQAINTPNSILYARALNNLGLLYRYHQQYPLSIPLHVKAFEIIKDQNGFTLDKMIFANNAGVAGRYNADYELAVSYYMKALRIAEAENSLLNIEIASNGLGNTFMAIPHRTEEGFNYLQRALEVAKQADNRLGLAMNYLTISGYHDNLHQHEKARSYLNKLLKLNQELNDTYGKAMTLKAFGESYLTENKNLALSEDYFLEAHQMFKDLGDKHRQALTLYNLGLVSFKQKNYPLSLERLNDALSRSEQLNDKVLIVNISEIISTIHEETANYSEALVYYKKARDYKDSINLASQEVQIATISNQFNLEKKEAEIGLLKKEQSFQSEQIMNHKAAIKNRGIIIFLLAAVFLTLAIIILLQYKNHKNKKAIQTIIHQQEKEKVEADYKRNLLEAEILANQMKLNPHFLFNCLNSIKYLIQQNDTKKAIKYLVKFSRFTRMVLESANKPMHSIMEELELTTYYLELEKNRFNSDFTYTFCNTIDNEANKVYLPTMLLQPFVENAIWHGLLPSNKEIKCVAIMVKRNNGMVEIHIEDNGQGRQEKKPSQYGAHKSRGTEIVDKRIHLFNKSYNKSLDYRIIDKKDSNGEALGTCVVLNIK